MKNNCYNILHCLLTRSKSQIDPKNQNEDEYDDLAKLIIDDELQKQQYHHHHMQQQQQSTLTTPLTSSEAVHKNTTRSVSSQFTHLNSFSCMSLKPPLGPFDENKSTGNKYFTYDI